MGIVVRLSIFELKNYLKNKMLLLLWGITIISIYLLPPYNFTVIKTKMTFIYLLPFVMIIYFSRILSKEFENKTYKILFTSTLTRFQVILYKVLTAMGISIILMFIYQLLLYFSNIIENKILSINIFFQGIASSTPVFLVYAFVIASFTFFITAITGKFAITFFVTYICFNDFVKIFLNLVVEKSNNRIISKIAEFIPFTITTEGFSLQYYSNSQIIWLLICSFVLLSCSFLIIEKKDYR